VHSGDAAADHRAFGFSCFTQSIGLRTSNASPFSWTCPRAATLAFRDLFQADPHTYVVYNYSSPLEGDDVSWLKGQGGPTSIYRMVFSLP